MYYNLFAYSSLWTREEEEILFKNWLNDVPNTNQKICSVKLMKENSLKVSSKYVGILASATLSKKGKIRIHKPRQFIKDDNWILYIPQNQYSIGVWRRNCTFYYLRKKNIPTHNEINHEIFTYVETQIERDPKIERARIIIYQKN